MPQHAPQLRVPPGWHRTRGMSGESLIGFLLKEKARAAALDGAGFVRAWPRTIPSPGSLVGRAAPARQRPDRARRVDPTAPDARAVGRLGLPGFGARDALRPERIGAALLGFYGMNRTARVF